MPRTRSHITPSLHPARARISVPSVGPVARLAAVLALGMVVVVGPLQAQRPSARGQASVSEAGLLVLAAASLADVLPQITDRWTSATRLPVRFSFDATSRLAPQATAGAPADVFVSADRAWMTWLEARGAVAAGAAHVVAENELVVVVPRGASVPADAAALARLPTLAVAGENVPAGRYARQALDAVGVSAGSGRELPRVVTGGSVRGVLEWVARGEVDAGVVYRTDAMAEPDVVVAFAFDVDSHEPIQYWAAPLVSSIRAESASQFVAYLAAAEASTAFRRAGFQSPPSAESTGSARSSSTGGAALPSIWSAVRLSLVVAFLATLAGLLPATALGWLLARHDFRGKTIVSTLVLAPLVMPPVVTGFLLLSLLGTQSPLGGLLASLGLPIPFTVVGAAIAALVVGLPLYVLSIRGAFEAVDAQYEQLSWTLGVPPRATFLRVSLPLALPGITAGAILAFARALGEFGATIVLAGNVEGGTRTIALAVYTLLESPSGRDTIWILVGASVALSLLALFGFETLSRRQRRRLERDHGS